MHIFVTLAEFTRVRIETETFIVSYKSIGTFGVFVTPFSKLYSLLFPLPKDFGFENGRFAKLAANETRVYILLVVPFHLFLRLALISFMSSSGLVAFCLGTGRGFLNYYSNWATVLLGCDDIVLVILTEEDISMLTSMSNVSNNFIILSQKWNLPFLLFVCHQIEFL